MAASKVTHPNFRAGPGQKNPSQRNRAIMVYLSQESWDRIMWALAEEKAPNVRDFIAQAIEEKLVPPASKTD